MLKEFGTWNSAADASTLKLNHLKTKFWSEDFNFKSEMCLEPKKLAELWVRNFCGDFNARNG